MRSQEQSLNHWQEPYTEAESESDANIALELSLPQEMRTALDGWRASKGYASRADAAVALIELALLQDLSETRGTGLR